MIYPEQILEYIREQQKEAPELIDVLTDLSIYSNGSVSYNDLKSMSYLELRRVQGRINEYWKNKAKANGGPSYL